MIDLGTTPSPYAASADGRTMAGQRARIRDAMQWGRDTQPDVGFSTTFENRCGRIKRKGR